ncbi:BTA121 domain-containing protein surface lipoprotein [Borrelia turicatae]|uniref:BTA121 domain-containing protein surface lipoprotein n=1 Tax=Borrelia turicatae TaxID=142 RepID=UPI002ED53B99
MVKKRCQVVLLVIILIIILLLVMSCKCQESAMCDEKLLENNLVRRIFKVFNDDIGDVKLNNLLSVFGISSERKKIMEEIQNAVTDPNIGKLESYKTYNTDEFYNLLYSLGALKIEEMIDSHLKNLQVQGEARNAIKDIIESDLRQELQNRFDDHVNDYPLYLKWSFNDLTSGGVYNRFMNGGYFIGFAKIRDDSIDILGGDDVYVGLSDSQQDVIDEMRDMVIDPKGVSLMHVTYDTKGFYDLLNKMRAAKVKRMIKAYLENKKARKELELEAREAILEVNREDLKQRLESDLNKLNDDYSLYFKGLFDTSSFDNVYFGVIDDNYATRFTKIKNNVGYIVEFDKLYKRLSDVQRKILDDEIRVIVTDADIGKDKDYKNYDDFTFEILLGELGATKVEKMVQVYFRKQVTQDEVRDVMDNISGDDEKQHLRNIFVRYKNDYKLHLKELFSESTADEVYNRFINDDYTIEYYAD